MALNLIFTLFQSQQRSKLVSTLLGNRVGVLEIDVTTDESHVYTSEATQFPVEFRANITDHVIEKPFTMTLTGVTAERGLTGFGLLGQVPQVLSGNDRIIEARDALKALHASRQPVTVVTGLDTKNNMVIVGLTFSRDASTGKKLVYDISLQQIFTVAGEFVELSTETQEEFQEKLKKEKQARAGQDDDEVSDSSLAFDAIQSTTDKDLSPLTYVSPQ